MMEDNYVRDDTGRSSQARDAEASNDPRVAEAAAEVVVDIRGVAVGPDHGDTRRDVGRVVVTSRPRYAYVRSDGYNDSESLYDILDSRDGCGRAMAHRVRFQPAVEIVRALNEQHE
jgi:hypothetical protein